ncbi:MAG: amidoligase family protein [Clostridia bacterium]
MNEIITCAICGAVLNEEDAREFQGNYYCEECLEGNTGICQDCGDRVWNSDLRSDGNIAVCNDCYDDNYNTCETCGRIIHSNNTYYEEDGDIPYCHNCYVQLEEAAIKPYSYKPEPIFYGSGILFMGVELEIDEGEELHDNAQALIEIAGSDRIYCKHDGSLDDGFEIVSHPMSLDYHIHKMPWGDVFEQAIRMHYRSHQTDTCGLHVHVNKTAFGKTYEEQEAVIAKIVHFFELHWNELVRFSRRTEANLQRWASRYGISDSAKDTYKKAKDKHLGRYVAVNLENYSTVEFRMWRGTLRYETFIATLQLVHEICRFAICLSDKEIENMAWSEFVLKINPEFQELIRYLKSKRLYVNEIENGTEEM